MPRLDTQQSLALYKIVIRAQNKLKGEALDIFEVAVPNERQLKAAKGRLKNFESALRKVLKESFQELNLVEDVELGTLMGMK